MATIYRKTEVAGVYATEAGTYVVRIKKGNGTKYFGTYSTMAEAREVCKQKRKELGVKENPAAKVHYTHRFDPTDPNYVAITESRIQCLRCTHPHLPNSVYCEYHKQRYEDGCYGETEESYIYEREIELGWRKKKPTRKSGQRA